MLQDMNNRCWVYFTNLVVTLSSKRAVTQLSGKCWFQSKTNSAHFKLMLMASLIQFGGFFYDASYSTYAANLIMFHFWSCHQIKWQTKLLNQIIKIFVTWDIYIKKNLKIIIYKKKWKCEILALHSAIHIMINKMYIESPCRHQCCSAQAELKWWYHDAFNFMFVN